jgi:hypothetical protein
MNASNPLGTLYGTTARHDAGVVQALLAGGRDAKDGNVIALKPV